MKTQVKKYSISFKKLVKPTFVEMARKSIVKKGKAPRTLSKDIDKILYGS